jgi:Flp pilus assembly protein TadG
VNLRPLDKYRRHRGLAIIEYLIAAPVALMLIVATAEIGRGFMQYNALTKSLRDAARYAAEAATTSSGTTGVVSIGTTERQAVQNLTVFGNAVGSGSPILPGLSTGNVTVTGSATGDVDVAATYQFQPIFSGIPLFGNGPDITPNITFQVQVTMRAL